jgi:hypothetical protein
LSRATRCRLLRLTQARRRLLRLRRTSGCLGTSRSSSRGSSCRSSSTTPRVRVPRHVARLVTRLVAPLFVDYSASPRLVVDYFAFTARPGASTRRAARHAARRAARRRLHRVRVPQHVARLVAPLVVDYIARPGASARRATHHAARRAARRRLLCLRCVYRCLGTSRGPSHGSSSTTPCAVTSSCGHAGSTSATPCGVITYLAATLALLRVRRAPPRRHLPVASRRPFISTSFPN